MNISLLEFKKYYKWQVETELTRNILPFWMTYTVDREYSGFYGEITNKLFINKRAPKGLVLCARILWTFAKAYRVYKNPAYLAMSSWAYGALINMFYDFQYRGYYWTVDFNSKPLNTTKEIYGQAFVIYALAEYYKVTQCQKSLQYAIELFHLLETIAHDDQYGGYLESFTREWKYTEPSIISEGRPNAVKSANTHMHIMEAYTNLLKVWKNPLLQNRLEELVQIFSNKIINSSFHLNMFNTRDWIPISKQISYGHDVEISWLLVEASQTLGNSALLAEAQKKAVKIAQFSLSEGIDRLDGGMYFEKKENGTIIYDKHWWVQAEAVVGFMNAYELSQDSIFLKASYHSWCFIERYIVDRIYGEWFAQVNKAGIPYLDLPKVSMWKAPYHGGRACFEIMKRLESL